MSHVAYTWGNWVDFSLLVVGNQTVSLIPIFSFDHNLCFRCPNGSCKPILNIYVSIAFQWYENYVESMGFDPYNCVLKIQESIWYYNSHNGSSFGSVRVHSLTLFCTPRTMRCDFRASFLAYNLVSLCLSREPKARVVTTFMFIQMIFFFPIFFCEITWVKLFNCNWNGIINLYSIYH
jgi:hypothetical protein